MNAQVEAAYQAFGAADRAWQIELDREFGSQSGDARYEGRGRCTPRLRALYAQFDAARRAWVKAVDA